MAEVPLVDVQIDFRTSFLGSMAHGSLCQITDVVVV